ncbi:hypothetical protein N780_09430 [Pontibacillus chungwhensis BH030062]|uniref:BIG2 domain-containing protein n=1 Tax=Pontibacillus chungwhensis BH030062 TaxID=1385513 RepID=A0A0A2UT24_9BACI|nr:glycosyl hydrolase 108 family protein [Pontibacillus chungwhensis]KGP89863.1 hypothetical protein N780_09430 [Pontibacillus chungwhensis BH030062]
MRNVELVRKTLISFIFFMLILSLTAYSVSAEATRMKDQGIKSFQEMINVPNDKEWTITFNESMDVSSINRNTVYVRDESGKPVETILRIDDDKSIKVKPPINGYIPGEVYTLYVSKALKAKGGGSLRKPVELVFVVEETKKNIPLQTIEIGQDSVSMNLGDIQELTAKVSPSDATNKELTWRSDTPSVVDVQNGMAIAVSEGTATITVTNHEGSIDDSIQVEVGERTEVYKVYDGQEFMKDLTDQEEAVNYARTLEHGKVLEEDSLDLIWEKEKDESTELELGERATLYGEPSYLSTTYGTLSPQKVAALQKKENGWYKVKTYLGEKWVAPEGMTVKVEGEWSLYNEPTITSESVGVVKNQEVIAIGAKSDGWLKINTPTGDRWLNQMIKKTPERELNLIERTVLYGQPDESSTTYGSLSPQSVTVVDQNGDWYQINTYLGQKWVLVKEPQLSSDEETTSTLKTIQLEERVKLYKESNYMSETYGTLSPQEVSVVEEKSNGWVKIDTYLGQKWVAPQGQTMNLSETHNVYMDPAFTSETISEVPAQEIVITHEKVGQWFKVSTSNGDGWINLSGKQPLPNEETQITLEERVNFYEEASFLSDSYGSLSPQTVTVLEDKGNGWYRIQTWTGDKWIAPDGIKLSVEESTKLFNEPHLNAKTFGQVSPQEVTVIGAAPGGWYQIKSWVGDKWIAPNGVDFILREQTFLYEEPSKDTKMSANLSPQTVKVLEKTGGEWYKVSTWLGDKWIFLGEELPDGEESYQSAISFAAKWEGGYSNHPNDYGGSTYKGITQRTYDAYRKSVGKSTRGVKYLTDSEYTSISYNNYFVPVHADEMDEALAIVMFDTAFNFGTGGAIQFLQRSLGVAADGAWGPITDGAFKDIPVSEHKDIALDIVQQRIDHRHRFVSRDPDQEVFLDGWLNRDNDLKSHIEGL